MATVRITKPAKNNDGEKFGERIEGKYNLGVGVPKMADGYATPEIRVTVHDETDSTKNYIKEANEDAPDVNGQGNWWADIPTGLDSTHTYTVVATIIGSANAVHSWYGIGYTAVKKSTPAKAGSKKKGAKPSAAKAKPKRAK
jgi:hypothetical protein